MSKVDWSLAPLLATHAGEFNGEFTCWYWLCSDGIWRYNKGNMDLWERVTANKPIADLASRPAQVKQWSGPQDGLPPVGLRVDYMGEHCTVVAHVIERNEKGAILQGADDWFYGTEITIDPIRTAADIAAEQRETAIREIMDIADVDCRVTAARLVDAGFKLPSKSESRDNAVDAMELIVPHIGSVAAGKLYDAGFKREVV